ncbi:MAG: hypothetical protein RIC80_21590 [Cyclobacteriaceae bacterium]
MYARKFHVSLRVYDAYGMTVRVGEISIQPGQSPWYWLLIVSGTLVTQSSLRVTLRRGNAQEKPASLNLFPRGDLSLQIDDIENKECIISSYVSTLLLGGRGMLWQQRAGLPTELCLLLRLQIPDFRYASSGMTRVEDFEEAW